MTSPAFHKPESSEARSDFYRRIGKLNAAPLWEVLGEIVGAHAASGRDARALAI